MIIRLKERLLYKDTYYVFYISVWLILIWSHYFIVPFYYQRWKRKNFPLASIIVKFFSFHYSFVFILNILSLVRVSKSKKNWTSKLIWEYKKLVFLTGVRLWRSGTDYHGAWVMWLCLCPRASQSWETTGLKWRGDQEVCRSSCYLSVSMYLRVSLVIVVLCLISQLYTWVF